MRFARLLGLLAMVLVAAGCGSSPPPAAPSTSASCSPSDAPSADVIAAEIGKLPAAQWRESDRGHTVDCRLHWVVVTSGDADDSPQQVLFFEHQRPLGTPTPQPRPYISVMPTGNETAVLQYRWRQGDDPACCPTGIGNVRFRVVDGRLTAVDPIPGP